MQWVASEEEKCALFIRKKLRIDRSSWYHVTLLGNIYTFLGKRMLGKGICSIKTWFFLHWLYLTIDPWLTHWALPVLDWAWRMTRWRWGGRSTQNWTSCQSRRRSGTNMSKIWKELIASFLFRLPGVPGIVSLYSIFKWINNKRHEK